MATKSPSFSESTRSTFHHFKSAFVFLFIGFFTSVAIGMWDKSATGVRLFSGVALRAGLAAGFIALVLAALEISLSFDNAIVNASVLQNMTELWQQRFLTWGMLIAVFLMRLVFPLAIVSVMAKIDPWSALHLAIFEPVRYAELMLQAHLSVATFGGTFLLLVCTHFFMNDEREGMWFPQIERPLSRLGKFPLSYVVVSLLAVAAFSMGVHESEKMSFALSAGSALLCYLFIHGLSSLLAKPVGGDSDSSPEAEHANKMKTKANQKAAHRASAAMFVYLEILDASFSFDGVVGAFAITNHLLIITIGLSVGAFFVRSLTLMFVEKKSLTDYVYLEAGAFYAIGLLAVFLFAGLYHEIPETITGLSGITIIGLAWYSSQKHNRMKLDRA